MHTPRTLSAFALVLLALVLGAGGCATGAGTGTAGGADFPENTVTVIGVGRVSIVPDLATLTVGVNVRSTTVAEGTAEATSRMSAVLARIKSLGVAEADIATVMYSVDPRVAMSRPEESARVVGYQVTNLAHITVRKMDTASAVLDAAMAAGANIARDVQFTRADSGRAQAEARAAAVTDAMAKARQLAAAAGVRLGESLSIRESPTGRPIMRGSGMGPAGAGPPLEPGQFEVVVSIELRQSIRP